MSRGVAIIAAAALATAIAVLSTSYAAAQGETISVDSVTVSAGGQAAVDMSLLKIGEPGLGAWTIDIVYDETVVSPVACTPHETGFCNADYASNRVRVTGASANGLQGDILLASITFECLAAGSTVLAPGLPALADASPGDPRPIAAAVQNGRITCAAGGPISDRTGDADCDGLVNSIDAALVLQYEAGLIAAVPCPENADVNEDGRINSIDAALILQHEAGLTNLGA